MNQLSFKITGLDCASEVKILKQALRPLTEDDDALSFDLLVGRMTVTCTSAACTVDAVRDAVGSTGMTAVPWAEHAAGEAEPETWWSRRGRTVTAMASGASLLLAVVVHALVEDPAAALGFAHVETYPLATAVLLLASAALGAWWFLPKAWYAARSLNPDINLLMIVAVIGAIALGELREAAMVCFLFAIAQWLETWSVGRARHAITGLMDLAPTTAHVVQDDGNVDLPVDDVPVGAAVLVRPGERVPLDGEVIDGATSINQAPITGESIPVEKSPGDDVYSGTINNEGAFTLRVTRIANDSSLARIIHMVEDAQSRRAPTEQWIEQFARVYTPIMMALALAVAVAPPLTVGMAWAESVYLALVMLLIACPCALVISTPVSIVAGLTSAARNGVLIKGGAYLEAAARLHALAVDKTGTLTTGRPEVQRVVALEGHNERELLARAAAIETLSHHPLAQAIVRHANDAGIAIEPADSYRAIEGKGAEAQVNGARYWIGSHRLLLEVGHDDAEVNALAESMEDAGHAVVLIGRDEHVCGLIAIADAPREESRATINALHDAGVRPVVMLTGDNAGTARALANATGVDTWHAELLPEDKVMRVRELVAEHDCVGMVGDGVNDAPALAESSLAIAMGAVGSDAAIETADIALMSDDLSRLPWLVRHARRTLRVIQQNVALAIGLKLAVLLLAVAGYATLWLAIIADMGASLLVIFNALRLLRGREE